MSRSEIRSSRGEPAPSPATCGPELTGSAPCASVPEFAAWVARSVFRRHPPLLPRLLHHTDEHVLQRELPFPRADHSNSVRFELLGDPLLARLGFFVRDNVQPLAEQRHSPPWHVLLQQVGCALRLIHDELDQMPRIGRAN